MPNDSQYWKPKLTKQKKPAYKKIPESQKKKVGRKPFLPPYTVDKNCERCGELSRLRYRRCIKGGAHGWFCSDCLKLRALSAKHGVDLTTLDLEDDTCAVCHGTAETANVSTHGRLYRNGHTLTVHVVNGKVVGFLCFPCKIAMASVLNDAYRAERLAEYIRYSERFKKDGNNDGSGEEDDAA